MLLHTCGSSYTDEERKDILVDFEIVQLAYVYGLLMLNDYVLSIAKGGISSSLIF